MSNKEIVLTGIKAWEANDVQELLPGMPPVPATGKKVVLPEEKHEYTLKDGKLVRLVVESPPDGGVPGMLAQIGVTLPQA